MKLLAIAIALGTVACGDDGSSSTMDAPMMQDDAPVDTNTSCVTPTGVRGRWRAENDVDNSVGGFTGTTVGNVTYGPGKHGTAFQFDGASAVKVDDMEMLWPSGSFSIETWIKAAPAFTGTGIALLKYACSDVCTAPNDKAYYALYMVSGAPAVDIRTNADTDILKLINTSQAVNDNQWHHLVGVRDSGAMTLSLYVDGALSKSMALTASQSGAMSDLDANLDFVVMGAATTTGGTALDTYFPGAVDDVAYYDRALTAAEVTGLFEAPEGACP